MTIWLKRRLALWLGSALAVFLICFQVGAQSFFGDTPVDTPPATMGEAARLFGRLLQVNQEQNDTEKWSDQGPDPAESYLKLRLISHRSRRQLGNRAIDILLEELAKNQTPVFTSSAPRQEEGKTIVDITPNPKTTSAPVVIVAEAGGYRVELLTTYAKRFKLSAGALETDIYDKTDIALEGLPGKDTAPMRSVICRSQIKEIAFALFHYAQDYDEKLPPAKQWIDALKPYNPRSEAIFTCPSLPKGQQYGYAFNSKLSQRAGVMLPDHSKIVSLYETTVLRRNAYGVGENLAFRHQNGANYVFVDGSVKWFAKTAIPNFKLKP